MINKSTIIGAALLSALTTGAFAQNMTQVKVVASGIDDAEEYVTGTTGATIGDVDLTSSDLEIMTDGTKKQTIGIRFTNINIPNGATIVRAFVQFANKGDKAPVLGDAYITAEYTGNASSFAATSFNITSRTLVSATPVLWPGSTATSWGTSSGGAAGADQRTPNIATVLQPVFDHASWSLGNSIAIVLTGEGIRNTYSQNGSAALAPKLIIEYTDAAILPLEATSLPLERGANWKYNDSGTDLGTTWTASAYDDATWSYGPAKLGYSDNPITTLSFGPSSSAKYPTYYFRKKIAIPDAAALSDSLDIELLADDGAIVYVNGTEVARTNMPVGAATYTTYALGDGDETAYQNFRVASTAFVNGENTVAVELHQSSASSSDIGFDFSLMEVPEMDVINFPIPKNSLWKYLDNGTDQGTAYAAAAYDDAAWFFGAGILGYGDAADQATTLSFGPDGSNKYPTTYFRKKFVVADLVALTDSLKLEVLRDDGALIYINGVEAVRSNLPAVSDYLTYAPDNIEGGAEDVYNAFIIPKSLFVADTNVIAVEIHQRSAGSSDMSFDLTINNYTPATPPDPCLPLASDHISNFVSVLPSSQPDSLRIPTTHTFQMLVQSGDPYTDAADGNTKGTFDFTGYIPVGTSSTNGYLSINHEASSWPGAGVSMLDINFDATTKLWEITNNEPVDFSVVQGTGRNCSGGITPWNTIITCEETLPGTDANADGYLDIGWAVEIDPATKQVVDHDGDGSPDKLWQVGRMSHENVVVAADSITLYEGNDENPGFIFKFVADAPGQLGSGTLYALKLDGALNSATTGTWIMIPNSTPTECNDVKTYANLNGATNFNQIEDVEISPFDSKIYFTSKSSGRVYRFQDDGTTVSEVEVFVGEESSIYDITHAGGTIGEQWRGGNDNLTFDDAGNLYVLQDGDRNHIWMVKPCHSQDFPEVELFAVTPAGCEPTGMTFSPDHKFMFVSMQHPSGSNATDMVDASGTSVRFNKESAIVIARREFLGVDEALPITFISFDAQLNSNNDVDLKWSFNNTSSLASKFEVQRMVLGGQFETINTVTVYDNAINKVHTAIDENPFAGRNLYRIKATDEAGKDVYTTIESVNISGAHQMAIAALYPNPTNGKANIVLVSPAEKQVSITVFNSIGTKVHSETATVLAGNNELILDMSDYAAGMYQVQIQNGNDVITQKIIKN